jgi:hypothetical protein
MENVDLADLSPNVEPAKRLRVAVHEAGHALVRSALFGVPDIIEITGEAQPEHAFHLGAMRPGPPRAGLPKVVSNTSDQVQFVHVAMVYLAGPAAIRLLDPRPHEWTHGEVEEDPGEIGGDGDECSAHDVCWEGAGGNQPVDGLKSQPELYQRALLPPVAASVVADSTCPARRRMTAHDGAKMRRPVASCA